MPALATPGTIVTVAPTGAEHAKADVPNLPVTLDELVSTAQDCERVGAAMIHVHISDAEARPTLDLGLLKETVAALRDQTNLIVQLSTGGAVTDPEDDRLRVLEAMPDSASCTMGTVNFGDDVFLNRWEFIVELHKRMQDRGIVPEYEIFDIGQLPTLHRLLDSYGPPAGGHVHVDLVMGVPGGMPGDTETLAAALRRIPDGRHVLRHRRRPGQPACDVGRAVRGRTPAGRHGGHRQLRPWRTGPGQRTARGQGRRGGADRPAAAAVTRRGPSTTGRTAGRLTPNG